MPKSVNKVILIGHLGRDPELKYTPNNVAVATFTVATNSRQKDKDGNWQDKTEWHSLVAWERTAEIAQEYLKKGKQVYIEGRLQTRSWDDKNTGEKRYKTEIVVQDLVLLGSAPQGEQAGSRPRAAAAPAGDEHDQRAPEAPATHPITDEDIPF